MRVKKKNGRGNGWKLWRPFARSGLSLRPRADPTLYSRFEAKGNLASPDPLSSTPSPATFRQSPRRPPSAPALTLHLQR